MSLKAIIPQWLVLFLRPPIFKDDEEKTPMAMVLNYLLSGIFIMMLTAGLVLVPFFIEKKKGGLIFVSAFMAILLFSRHLMHKGQIRSASQLLVLSSWVAITMMIVLGAGLRDMNFVFLVSTSVVAGLLLGRRFVGFIVILSILFSLFLVIMERWGYLPFWYFPNPPMVRWFELVFSLITTATVLHLAITRREETFTAVRDQLAERRLSEEALQESEKRYRLMADNMADVIWTMDSNFNFTYVSPSVTKMRGVTVKEALSEKLADYLTPASLQAALRAIEQENEWMQKKPGDIDRKLTIELEYYRKDGTTFWAENEITYLLGENQEPVGIVGVTRDITERKVAEEERQRLEERLSRAEKMESLGRLAGGVAHDLNNVLGVLVGYSELLLMDIPGDDPLRKHVSNILQSSQRGAAIIQDLLTLARRGVAVSTVVNLNHIVSEYFETPEFEKLKESHSGIIFNFDPAIDLLNIRGSSVHLGKTVMNLVSNAAEAITNQGEVMVRTENRYLDKPIQGYDTMEEGEYVVLTVSDNGNGIPVKDIGRIFEPFYTKKVMGRSGTGLGLAVVWGTVKDHGGFIDVQSREGEGSTFTLYFPVIRQELTREEGVVPPEEYAGRGESILVVDDVKEQRELATAMLGRMGYKVDSVSSGEEALSFLKTSHPALLVLDMIMDPGMDGLETYQRILEINPKQKAIIVSGFSETSRVKKTQELGAGAYVRKPYISEKIGLAVRRELDRI